MVDENKETITPEEDEQNQNLDKGGQEDAVNQAIPEEGGKGAGDSKGDQSLKDKLGEALGKEFPSDEAALKSVKDTFSYVGEIGNLSNLKETMGQLQKTFNTNQKGVVDKLQKVGQAGSTDVDPDKFVSREEFDRAQFYTDKSEYKSYSNLVETFKKANPDKSREEIIEMNDFKSTFQSLKAQKEADKSKSVLKSNPKLGKVSDKMTEAKESQQKGQEDEAGKKATDAVIDAYDIGK